MSSNSESGIASRLRRRAQWSTSSIATDASTESEDEYHVDRSLPSSPAEPRFPGSGALNAQHNQAEASPSTAYRFAMADEAVLRHAAGAFDGDDGVSGMTMDDTATHSVYSDGDDITELDREEFEEQDVKMEPLDEDDELREGTAADWNRLRRAGEGQARRRGWGWGRGDGAGAEEGRGREGAPGPEELGAGAEIQQEEEEEEEPPDERQCRICFSGAEEEETLGRLISPCLCTGSMRYVHVQCINAWRGTGTNAKAFMECPQCHHRYTLRRTLISGLATSRLLLLMLSSLVFTVLTISIGHILHRYLIPTASPFQIASTSSASARQLIKRPFSIFDLLEEDWDEFDNGVILVGGGVGGGTLIWDVVMASIDTFASVAERFAVARRRIGRDGNWVDWAIFALGIRFLLGIAVLGSLSFLSLLLSFSLFAPFQLANGLRGTGLLNSFNRRARATGGGARQGSRTAAGQIMMVIFVLVGAVNTLIQVYNLVRKGTERGLKYVETQILEVNPEDRRRASRRRRRAWYWTWCSEGRWATRAGWEEVRVRLWVAARGGLGPVWENMWARGVDVGAGAEGAGAGVIQL